jgi:glycosyltransferase involved in cell wall biosynthesis
VVPNIDVPSRRFEGFGLVAAEAAASGGVVLAADQGGLRDAVIDGITGFLLPPGDAAAWAAAITALRDWPAEGRAAFLGAATASARHAFGWERVARETLAAYRGKRA